MAPADEEDAAAAAAAAAATVDGRNGVLLFVLKANKRDGGDRAPGLSKSMPCLEIIFIEAHHFTSIFYKPIKEMHSQRFHSPCSITAHGTCFH